MSDGFDLYDDLDDALIQPLERDLEKKKLEEKEKSATEKGLTEAISRMQAQLDDKTEIEKNLNEVINNLNYNLSCLLETARQELKRKETMIKDWQRKWDGLMFRRKKGAMTQSTQTEFHSEHRVRDRSRDRRRSHHRSPEKIKPKGRKSSSTDNDSKHKHDLKTSSRDDRPRIHSFDKPRDADNSRDRRKRSRSRSPKRVDEKRLKVDERPRQTDHKKEPDLRLSLLKKQVNRTSPRKPRVDSARPGDTEPKVLSPRKRKTHQSQEKAPTVVLSIKSSDSEVEIVDAANVEIDIKTFSKNTTKEKEKRIKVNGTDVIPIEKEEIVAAGVKKFITEDESSSFETADDTSKSPKLSELEKEILAAENYSLERTEDKVATTSKGGVKGFAQNDNFPLSELHSLAKMIQDELKDNSESVPPVKEPSPEMPESLTDTPVEELAATIDIRTSGSSLAVAKSSEAAKLPVEPVVTEVETVVSETTLRDVEPVATEGKAHSAPVKNQTPPQVQSSPAKAQASVAKVQSSKVESRTSKAGIQNNLDKAKKSTSKVKSSTTKVKSAPTKIKNSPAKVKTPPVKAIVVPELAPSDPPKTEQTIQHVQPAADPPPDLQVSLNGTLDSSGGSKENSFNKSKESSLNKSKKKKRTSKIYTKNVKEDGTVVFTITYVKKSKKKKEDKTKEKT